jgi:tetratricopeptide (TPR) repeat protein
MDVYRNFVVPVPVEAPAFVRALELRPGNAKVVHHARILIDRTGRARSLDAKDEEPGYDGMLVDGAEFPDGLFLGWSPGRTPLTGDDAFVWRLEPGTDLVLQLHMMPRGEPETLRPEVGLYFTEEAPGRRSAVLQLGSRTIDIPAGAKGYAVEDRYVLPADVDVLGIYPHAHYLCREMRVDATLPDGALIPLLWIPSWDFFWQEEYRYQEPVPLPRGATISMRYVYDNGTARRVRWGPRSTDEMGDLLLMVSPREPPALEALREDFRRNELQKEVAGYEKSLSDDPEDPRVRHELAFALMELGRTGEAIAELRRVVEERPGFAEALYNLGSALAREGRNAEAVAALESAVAADPRYAEAHNNLGVLLQSEGRLEDALRSYRRAIALRPDYAFARHNLGSALLARGALLAAIAELSEAVRIAPGYAQAHYTLASALGRAGRIDEEIGHYRRALEASPDYVEALSNLGAALVTAGRAGEAIEPLRRALGIRPGYAAALINLGAAHRARGELAEAEVAFRRALASEPLSPLALAGLAWVLAVHPEESRRDPAKAVALAERASRLARDDASVLDALAAAYAAAGRFEDAVAEAERALVLSGAEEIRARLELYRRGQPFRSR